MKAEGRRLASLASAVLRLGEEGYAVPEFAEYFGLPSGPTDMAFQHIVITPEVGHRKAIAVRQRRGSDRLDIIVIDSRSKQGRGSYFYLTSVDGILEKAVFKRVGEPWRALKAERGARAFRKEVGFWLTWGSKAQEGRTPRSVSDTAIEGRQ